MSESDDRKQLTAVLEDELYKYCQSESLSVIGLHVIFERHGLESNNDYQIRNYRFFFVACKNKRVTEGIIRCLLEYFPDAAGAACERGWSSLHFACDNNSVKLNIIRILIDAAPDSVRNVCSEGRMPLHNFCSGRKMDEKNAVQILKLLIEKYPEAVRHANNRGRLPIHYAALTKSPEFCRVLEAYPGSEQKATTNGGLPLHWACAGNTLATVEYLYHLYPNSIHHATTRGHYPIHTSILGTKHRNSPSTAVEIVQFLLDCDPNVKAQTFQGMSLLRYVCVQEYNDSNIEAGIQMIKVIFDAHPEAIEDNRITTDIRRSHQRIRTFINGELVYARKAKDHRLMTTPDDNGRLPLHVALQNNVRLGSIKLLIKGNLAAIISPDNSGALPLHIACQHHDSTNIIDYLVELDNSWLVHDSTLGAVDRDGNTALHLACRSAKYETITLFLEKYNAVSVSKRNVYGELPINLLWESNPVEDRGSIEYTESVFRLLKAYPETLRTII